MPPIPGFPGGQGTGPSFPDPPGGGDPPPICPTPGPLPWDPKAPGQIGLEDPRQQIGKPWDPNERRIVRPLTRQELEQFH
ncbi:MAG: hypothetical protein AB7S38_42685 [Vulcanimicrobiota bacterium]